jgi:pilus assembly protein CpaE
MRVVVAQEQSEQMEPLRQTLLGMGLECGAGDCVGLAELPVRLSQGPPDLVLVRIGDHPAAAYAALQQALTLTKAPLLALGPASDPQRIMEATHNGARAYLDETRLQEDLEKALNTLRAMGLVPEDRCQVVGVASPTSGSGVTSVAINLAFTWAASKRQKGRVALVELAREAPTLALSLDLSPRFTVPEVASNWQRMDAAFLRQSLVPHPDGVHVLAHKAEALEGVQLDPQAVRKTVLLLRTLYSSAVLDLGHLLGPEHYEAMRLCDLVAVVVRLDVPSVRLARRFLRHCAEQGVAAERIRLIANRYGERGQLGWKQAEETVGAKFAEWLPDDSGGMNRALTKGKPVVLSGWASSLTRRFGRLAKALNGQA